MPNVVSYEGKPKKKNKKRKMKNEHAAADNDDELTESDDPPPPKPSQHRQKAKLTAGDRDKIAELAVQKMKSSEISESGSVSIEQLIQLGVVQRVPSRKQTLLETLLKHSNNDTASAVALLKAVENSTLFNTV